MLVLTRRPNESIIIANNIKITVVSVGPGRVKLGIEAPPSVRVDRKEIHDKIEQATDVLAVVAGATPQSEQQNNTLVVHGPDTALILPPSANTIVGAQQKLRAAESANSAVAKRREYTPPFP